MGPARRSAVDPGGGAVRRGRAGAILTGDARAWCESLPGVTVATVAAGHFVREDAAPDLARILRDWVTTLDRD